MVRSPCVVTINGFTTDVDVVHSGEKNADAAANAFVIVDNEDPQNSP